MGPSGAQVYVSLDNYATVMHGLELDMIMHPLAIAVNITGQ